MTVIQSRIAEAPYRCPFCGHHVHPGRVIAVVITGSTESSGCMDCAWKAFNKVLPVRREAS